MTAKAELRNFIQHYGLDETKEALAEIEEEMNEKVEEMPGFEGTREDLEKISIN